MINHRRTRTITVTAWFVFLIICGFIISRTQFATDLSAFLPKNPSAEQQLLLDQINDGLSSRLILVGIEGDEPAIRAKLSKRMAQPLRNNQAFIAINNGEPIYTKNDQAYLFDNRYLLSPAVNPEHFSEKGLNQSINESIELLASSAGLIVKSILPNDPTGEMLQLLDQFNSDRQPTLIDGVWASRDGNRALLLIQTRASGSDIDAQQSAMMLIQQAFEQASTALTKTAPHHSLDAKLRMAGPGVFSVNTRETIKHQVLSLSMISIILITTLLLLVYRSFKALLLGLLPVLSGVLAGITAVSLGFGTVHGITLGFGTALIGEAVDYSIYLFIQSEQGSANQQSWVKQFWPTIRLGVLTSICGFASLLFSGFPGLAQLGLYAISGLTTAAIVTRFVLPQLLPANFRIHDDAPTGRKLAGIVNLASKIRWPIIVLLLIACTILFSHRNDLWSKEIASLSPISKEDIALDTSLRADVGASDVRYLVVATGKSRESVLRTSEQVSTLLQLQVEEGTIASFETPSRYLPSEATQRTRQASLPTTTDLNEKLIQATKNLPVKVTLFAPFLADVESARQQPLLQASQLEKTSMAMAIDALLLQKGERWSALLPLTAPKGMEINAHKIQQVLNASQLPNVTFIDMKKESDRLYSGYMQEAIMLSLSGLVAIIILLLFTFKSITQVLRIIAPLAAAVVTVTASLAFLGQQLIILHLVGLLLVVAVGSNYALFFNTSSNSTPNTPRVLASMLFANLTTVIGFGLLAFSNVSILQAIGVTVAPGVILSLIYSTAFAKKPNA
ncbi:MAG: MMPL family transporter [Methylophilaceae bacterium]